MIPVAVQTVHAQGGNTAPIISPEEGSFIGGQLITVGVTFGYNTPDQGSYTVALYASPTDSCLGPFTPSELVAPALTGQSGPGPITFTFVAPYTNLFLCANVIDNGVGVGNEYNAPDGLWSGPATYTVSPPLSSYINNDENFVTIDLGQSITLTDFVSGGNAPYSYQWYSDEVCGGSPAGGPPSATDAISGATAASTTVTPGAVGVTSYSVFVTDSSVTPNTTCEVVTVVVNPTLTGTFVIGPCTVTTGSCEFDGQVGSPALTAIVTFGTTSTCAYPKYDPTCVTGTGPWRAVTIFSGTDSVCSGDTKQVAHLDDINGSQAILNFPEPSTPSTTTFYCAVLSDSSMGSSSAYPLVLGPISLGISPALSTPVLSLDVTQTDYNIPATVHATVTYVGGTSPYTVELFTGSTPKGCSLDDVPVTASGLITTPTNPITTLASSVTFTITVHAQASSAYFCAVVSDSSSPPSITESPSVLFTVEPIFAVNEPTLSTNSVETLSPYYEGNVMSATVTWSGGTGPYVAELFYGSWNPTLMICTPIGPVPAVAPNGFNPVVDISGTSATFSFLAPNAPSTYWCYYDQVTDINGQTLTSDMNSAILHVASALSVTLTPSPQTNTAIDTGQTDAVSLMVSWSGGNPPFTVSILSGTSSSCSADTSTVATQSGLSGSSATFNFNVKLTTTTYYCAKVTDGSVPPSIGVNGPFVISVYPDPSVTLPLSYEIAAGSGTTLVATGSGGTPPLMYQWFIGTTSCAAADAVTAPSTSNTYSTGVISTATTYSVQVTDSSSGTPAVSACASIVITVNNGPIGVAAIASGPYAGLVYVANPTSPGTQPNADSISVIDSDSNSVVTTIPLVADGGLLDGSNFYAPVFAAGCPISPWGVAADPTNGVIYVTGSTGGLTGPGACPSDPNEGVLAVINIATNVVESTYDLGSGTNPLGVAVNPNPIQSTLFGEVYIADNAANAVDVWAAVPPASISYPIASVFWGSPVLVGPGPMGVAVDPNTFTVYVTDNGGNTVSVLQPVLNPIVSHKFFDVTTVNVGFQPVGVAVDSVTDNVYVANSGSGTVTELNGFTYATIATIKVGGAPQGIDINSATATAYVANAATNSVSVINLKTNAVTTTTAVGGGPFGVAVDAPNGTVFVTNSGANTVSVISLANNQVIATIVVP